MIKKILLALLVILIVIQFIRPDRSVPELSTSSDLFANVEANEVTKNMIRSTCYDCHSFESEYPWYSSIAPVSYWLQGHINEGREKLNFSLWTEYNGEKKKHKLEECVEMLENDWMPLESYKFMHSEARFTEKQRSQLIAFFKEIK